MRKGVLDKIQRVYQYYVTTYKKGKVYKRGPYWFGCYREKGKEFTVHIGKALPDELGKLLKERIKLPGDKKFTWQK